LVVHNVMGTSGTAPRQERDHPIRWAVSLARPHSYDVRQTWTNNQRPIAMHQVSVTVVRLVSPPPVHDRECGWHDYIPARPKAAHRLLHRSRDITLSFGTFDARC